MRYGQGNYCYSAIPSAPVLSPITSTNVEFQEKKGWQNFSNLSFFDK